VRGGLVDEAVLVMADVAVLLLDESLERTRAAARGVRHDVGLQCAGEQQVGEDSVEGGEVVQVGGSQPRLDDLGQASTASARAAQADADDGYSLLLRSCNSKKDAYEVKGDGR
jgi:hypothetical protein